MKSACGWLYSLSTFVTAQLCRYVERYHTGGWVGFQCLRDGSQSGKKTCRDLYAHRKELKAHIDSHGPDPGQLVAGNPQYG